MSDPERPAITGTQQQAYLERVRAEIKRLNDASGRMLVCHRITRTVVVVFAAAVPVLAVSVAVPRVVLAAVGAVAVVAESVGSIFQWHGSATNMVRTRNALERELNRFLYGVGVYAGPLQQSYLRFVERTEDIREMADRATAAVFKKSTAAIPDRVESGKSG